MDRTDALHWLEDRKDRIEQESNGPEIYQAMRNLVLKMDDNCRIYDKPVYWACFVVSRPYTKGEYETFSVNKY